MSQSQHNLVVAALVAIALALAFLLLQWSDQYDGRDLTKIVVFYTSPKPGYSPLKSDWGIYTSFGLIGILLGVIIPLCLISLAAYVALGKTLRPTPTKANAIEDSVSENKRD